MAAGNVERAAGALAGHDSDLEHNDGRVAAGQQRSFETGCAWIRQNVSK